MRKLKVFFMITIIAISSIMMCGCEKGKDTVQEKEEQSEAVREENIEENSEEKDVVIIDDNNEDASTEVAFINKMKIYYADSGTGEIISKSLDVENVTPEIIWEQLKQEQIINEECMLNKCTFNEEENKIDLDVNEAFGNYIRGMGTTGEDIVITCIVRSYLETYGYDEIKITEVGNVLETGHAILDGYMGIE